MSEYVEVPSESFYQIQNGINQFVEVSQVAIQFPSDIPLTDYIVIGQAQLVYMAP